MPVLENLPVEIVEEIASWIENDLKKLRLVSKHLNQAAQRVLWATHALVVDFGPGSWIKVPNHGRKCVLDIIKFNAVFIMLRELENRSPSCNLIQRLVFKVGPWASLSPDCSDEAGKFMHRELPGLLPGALSSLQGLVSARVEVVTGFDPDWLYELLFGPLAVLPLLRELTVDDLSYYSPKQRIALPLHLFNHGKLKKLSIGDRYQHGDEFVPSVTKILAQNPEITHLKLDNYAVIGAQNIDLRVLFRNVDVRSLHLQHLHIHGWFVDFSAPEILPHIRSLRGLELASHHENYPSALKTLRNHDIYLRKLRYHTVTDELVTYLESYMGLEELSLPYTGYLEHDERAGSFYCSTLYGHRDSLRELHVASVYEPTWIIGLHNVGVFDSYEKLVSLSVGLKLDDINPGLNEGDVIATLLMRLVRLPTFRRLRFTKVERKGERTMGSYGTSWSELEDCMESRIKSALQSARFELAPPSLWREVEVFTPADVAFESYRAHEHETQALQFRPRP
ncbi:hypothetical protein V5O48_003496 [Marasmius crinis-equi]|uniref:F-box domain-containing protein n=1 Tax=Marasmius crinis-equi TaxID=585013 RepID=A0ABR3FSR7_9AGAR